MRKLSAIAALPLLMVNGCTYTLQHPDELYRATDYAPQPDPTPGAKDPTWLVSPVGGCGQGSGVEPLHAAVPRGPVRFRALPGMTLVVTEVSGRLTGASE